MPDARLAFGTNHCLCGECGEYFTSDYTFRMHRVGSPESRRCRHPDRILDKERKPRLRLTDTGLWASARRRIDHWRREQ